VRAFRLLPIAVVVAVGFGAAFVLTLAPDSDALATERTAESEGVPDLRTEIVPAVLTGRPGRGRSVASGRDGPAEEPANGAPSAPTRQTHDYTTYALHGRVLDAESGEPVPTARVFLWPRGVPASRVYRYAFG
jgi:hypothetical protein